MAFLKTNKKTTALKLLSRTGRALGFILGVLLTLGGTGILILGFVFLLFGVILCLTLVLAIVGIFLLVIGGFTIVAGFFTFVIGILLVFAAATSSG